MKPHRGECCADLMTWPSTGHRNDHRVGWLRGERRGRNDRRSADFLSYASRMNLDDGGGFVSEFGQCLAECAARSAMSPEYVGWVVSQEITMQMQCATSCESVERITGMFS